MMDASRWIGWGAGSFSSNYNLVLSPQGGKDVPLVTQCFAGKFQTTTAKVVQAVSGETYKREDVPAPSRRMRIRRIDSRGADVEDSRFGDAMDEFSVD